MNHIIPTLQRLTQHEVEAAVSALPATEQVSCRAGCGACCRQMVPISLSEAVFLTEQVMAGLSEEHRQRVMGRIREAERALAEVGMMERLQDLPSERDPEVRQKVGICYMLMGIACPFLDEGNCSIHPLRPLACREYLVTSDATHCATPQLGSVKQVPIPHKGSHALIRMDAATTHSPGWMPMILALIHYVRDGNAGDFALPDVQHPEIYLQVFLQLLLQQTAE